MTFEDLPRDWPTRPVTDPQITADLLDLIVGERDRQNGAIGVLVCGTGGRLSQPVVVSEPPTTATLEERRVVFDAVGHAMGETERRPPGAGLLVAVARRGAPLVTAGDRSWLQAAEVSCADAGLILHGVWLMTPAVIRPIPRSGEDSRRSA